MNPDPKEELLALKNLGPKSVAQLVDVGITSSSQLIELGTEEVFRRLYFRFCDEHRLSVNYLYALEGAVTGCDWRLIPMGRKKELKNLLKGFKVLDSLFGDSSCLGDSSLGREIKMAKTRSN